jgi:hypothetical protein
MLPELVYLVFPEFEPFVLAYPAFAVFKLQLLVPVCICLAVVVFGCLALVSPIGSIYKLLVLVYLLSIGPLADLISSHLFPHAPRYCPVSSHEA